MVRRGSNILDDLPPTPELLRHFKSRVATFEEERNVLLGKIDECKLQHKEKHKLEFELRRREEEVRDLQKALSEAHTCLFEERERFLEVQRDNDDLRLQEIEDRKRIQQLLSLTQPVEQEITYSRNTKPETVEFYPVSRDESDGDQDGGKATLRTVIMPTEHTDTLLLKVESLKSQLDEHKKFANERIAALLEDRRIREQEEDRHRQHYESERHDLQDKLRNTEELLYRATKDVLTMRQEKQEAETAATEAVSGLNSVQDVLVSKFEKENRRIERKTTKKYEERLRTYKARLEQNETEMANMEAAHSALKFNYEKRIGELGSALSKLRKQHKQLEYRRALDLTGFNSDISHLRKKLVGVDRKLHGMRLVERLDDHDRLHHLLEHLDRMPPALTDGRGKQGGRGSGRGGSARERGAKAKASPMVDLTKEVPATTDLLRDIDRVREELRNVAENLVNAVPEEAVY